MPGSEIPTIDMSPTSLAGHALSDDFFALNLKQEAEAKPKGDAQLTSIQKRIEFRCELTCSLVRGLVKKNWLFYKL